MRSSWPGSIILAAVLVAAASSLEAQASSAVTWSGTMRSATGTRQVRYIAPATNGATGFRIIPDGTLETGGIAATGIRFEGISLRFRAHFDRGADCKLDAIPARGYKGTCTRATGDTIDLTLVPPIDGMLLPDHEVRLARDAAPPHIAREASVFVLGTSGYVEVVRGTNAFTCFIERPTARDLWPICHNREASEHILPVEQFRARLRIAGIGEGAITDSVLDGYRSGRFHAPVSGALGYMLSRHAWTANAETGAPTFISPHLHFYAPAVTNALIGVVAGERPVVPMRVEREGRPDASVIVGVRVIEPVSGSRAP